MTNASLNQMIDEQPQVMDSQEELPWGNNENIDPDLQVADAQIDLSLGDEYYYHHDRYSKVWYEKLVTQRNNEETPIYGIYSASPNQDLANRNFCGVITNQYKFMSNAAVVEAVLASLGELGGAEIEERYSLTDNHVMFRSDISVVNRGSNIEEGSIIPVITVENSYNGSKAATYLFGLEIKTRDWRSSMGFREKISSMRQVHIIASRTTLSANIGQYIGVFSQNITDLVSGSQNTILSPEDVIKSINLVEKIGKKRYSGVVVNLSELIYGNSGQEIDAENPPAVSAWKMFLAIAKYAATEENLNAKKLLDNIAERTLIVPTRMVQALSAM